MAGKWTCAVCGRSYARKDTLARHQKRVHGVAGMAGAAVAAADEGALPVGVVEVPLEAGGEPALGEGDCVIAPQELRLLKRALVDLGIEAEDVMSYRVYPDRVVIIQGPIGFKRVWFGRGK